MEPYPDIQHNNIPPGRRARSTGTRRIGTPDGPRGQRIGKRIGRCRRSDEGFAILSIVLVIGSVLVLGANMLFQTAIDNITTASQTVQEEQALQAAQAGLDITVRDLRAATSLTTVPCTTPLAGTLGSAPYASSYKVSFIYFSTVTGLSPLTCSAISSAHAVELSSVGTDGIMPATMVALADLSTTPTNDIFGDAVWASSVSISNSGVIDANGKVVYTNSSQSCSNTGEIEGTLVVIGTLTVSNHCHITGRVTVVGKVKLSNTPTIGSTLKSRATITISNDPTINGNLYAKGAISAPSTWETNFKKTHTVNADDKTLPTLSSVPFPTIKYTATGWEAKGYQVVTDDTCTTSKAGSAKSKILAMNVATVPLAIYTTCEIQLANHTTVDLAQSLAIVSTGGFSFSNTAQFEAEGSAAPDLYLIVPSTPTGASGKISMSNSSKIGSNIDALLYTPNTVTMSNSSSIVEGAVYVKGKYSLSNGVGIGLPLTVPGSSNATAGAVSPVSVGILFERDKT